MKFENLFDLEEAKKQNILVSGCNQIGKTRLACAIASMLHKLGYTVIAIDVSGKWKRVSDLPYYSKVYKVNGELVYAKLEGSGIYDLSLLKLSESKKVTEEITEEIWNKQIALTNPNHTFVFIEESEAHLRNIRGSTSENIYRLVHIGANVNVRCCLVTTDLALLDTSVIRLCSIRFHGRLNIEQNSKAKFSAYYGKDYTRIAMEGLSIGDFIRVQDRKIDIISVPLFKPRNNPQLYMHFEQTEQTEPLTLEIKPMRIRDLFKAIVRPFKP